MDAKFYPNKEDTAYELSNKEDRSSFKRKKKERKKIEATRLNSGRRLNDTHTASFSRKAWEALFSQVSQEARGQYELDRENQRQRFSRRLRKAKDVVFECGPNCGCGPDCINRISQRGIKYQLEVFRTLDRGWAVRTKDFIPSGAPVCEYVGILRRTDELDKVDVNDYIFEIDCLHTIKGIEGRERRFGAVSASLCDNIEKIEDGYLEKTPEFCIDANHIGNVSRFVNHSCEPNLFVQCILSTHHDFRLARIVLFAARSISPWQELTYDYGYPLDSVIGSDGEVKVQPCYCGAEDCRRRLY